MLAGAAGVSVILAGGLARREDIWGWWQTRGAVKVDVLDFAVGERLLEGPESVAQVRDASRIFIQSLQKKRPSDVEIVGDMSNVVFQPLDDQRHRIFSVDLVCLNDLENGVVRCRGVRYLCTLSGWFDYLRRVLEPLTQKIVAEWRQPDANPTKRLRTAVALALLAPQAEGLVEFFREGLSGKPREDDRFFWAILCLGEMGPLAGRAVPSLLAAMDRIDDEELRAAAKKTLRKIQGAAP